MTLAKSLACELHHDLHMLECLRTLAAGVDAGSVNCTAAGVFTGSACILCSSLQGVGLIGTLPAALGSLEQLEILNLANNQLSGLLPDTWGSVNASFSLQQLLLNGNQLDGGLPSEWGRPGRWPALTSMQLGDNNLTGGLPTTWSDPGALFREVSGKDVLGGMYITDMFSLCNECLDARS